MFKMILRFFIRSYLNMMMSGIKLISTALYIIAYSDYETKYKIKLIIPIVFAYMLRNDVVNKE